MTRPNPWRLVSALGVAQIVSWGTLYYAIAVLGGAMREELGLSAAQLFGAYALALFLSGVAAPWVGRSVDRYGGRLVLAAGSLLAAVALFAIGRAESLVGLYFAWSLAGLAMATTLYEPAFAALHQHSGSGYRAALTGLTLFGGLASTVFWPLSWLGLSHLGWRSTYEAYAVIELLLCLPLHLTFIPRTPPQMLAAPSTAADVPPGPRPPGFWMLATALAANAFVVSAIGVHFINILQAKGFALQTAVWIASFIGPMSVAGRLAEFLGARRLSARAVGGISLAVVIAAMGVLLVPTQEVVVGLAFALLYGASNGVLTIVRGVVPGELFGRERYGGLLGDLAAPALLARAAAPLVCAPLAARDHVAEGWLWLLAGLAVVSLAGYALALARASRS